MRNDPFHDGLFDAEMQVRLSHLQEGAFDPFIRQVQVAGLDPASDFQHADLRGVDFSYSDLAGYNFTGANLRGATGIAVRWDETTIFSDTELEGSIFSQPISLGTFFGQDPKAKDWLARVNRWGTTQKILWSADQLRPGAPQNDVALPIAKEIFWKASDAFLRSQLMFFMAPRLDDQTLKELLITSMSEHSSSGAVIINALDTAKRRGMMADKAIRSITCALLLSEHAVVRAAAMSVLMRHRPSAFEQSAIYNAIKVHSNLGATYVQEAARSLGEEYKVLVRHPVTGEVLRPGQALDGIALYLMARRWLRLEANVRDERKGIPLSRRQPAASSFREEEVRQRMRVVVEKHDHLRSFGIQFLYDKELPDKSIPGLPQEPKKGD
ncbi:pentapeptide repeat-containing protein [Devosia neptuniae]|uniref:pentapeptide repeat-containing protein n=1 Tax=Devosia neptuniae TaxID=191302 RepID=UPI0022AF5674|nr:pentapeptide repeat-containing protein [Devosia neptuniae]MCZ4345500.1 pentapeptide repeat-containing protein [Devosia neptuniae]